MDINDLIWNPWHGCHKYSEWCQNCFAFFLDKRYGRDTNTVVINKSWFDAPIKKDREWNYKMKSWSFIRVCMASDFFIQEADEWRDDAREIIKKRPDMTFSLLTKRADRILDHLPKDWWDMYDNVCFAVSCENQIRADERIPYLLKVPTKHRWISLKPFIWEIDLEKYLSTWEIETVLAWGENYLWSRPLHYEWVEKISQQCKKYNVEFIFAQTGNIFIKEWVEYKIHNRTDQQIQALKADLSYPPKNIDEEINKIMEKKKMMKEKRNCN